jgi:hypothetical protein
MISRSNVVSDVMLRSSRAKFENWPFLGSCEHFPFLKIQLRLQSSVLPSEIWKIHYLRARRFINSFANLESSRLYEKGHGQSPWIDSLIWLFNHPAPVHQASLFPQCKDNDCPNMYIRTFPNAFWGWTLNPIAAAEIFRLRVRSMGGIHFPHRLGWILIWDEPRWSECRRWWIKSGLRYRSFRTIQTSPIRWKKCPILKKIHCPTFANRLPYCFDLLEMNSCEAFHLKTQT